MRLVDVLLKFLTFLITGSPSFLLFIVFFLLFFVIGLIKKLDHVSYAVSYDLGFMYSDNFKEMRVRVGNILKCALQCL